MLAREISEILAREIKDPRVEGVTVVDVKAAGDLRSATVFYRVVGIRVDSKEEAAAGLKSASGALRRMLGERINLKFTPELDFRYDPTEDRAERIEALLREVLPAKDSRDKE